MNATMHTFLIPVKKVMNENNMDVKDENGEMVPAPKSIFNQ